VNALATALKLRDRLAAGDRDEDVLNGVAALERAAFDSGESRLAGELAAARHEAQLDPTRAATLLAQAFQLEPFHGDVGRNAETSPPIRTGTRIAPAARATESLADLLDEARVLACRYVVFEAIHGDAIALWVAHTYRFECAPASPYLHAYSPEPGSGKTTLLDVLAVLAANPIQADNLTEAVLFRLIDQIKPTLLFDEVDAVFARKNADSTEGIRQSSTAATAATRRRSDACRRATRSSASTSTAQRRWPA
jgi:hypothetical protein